ncbi:hypothetical protein EGR_08315 [Echinococcus granulosus]|uniref:Uncharacterized protein n=1 Tax=Echinococcus granulosus TaxID=6210 RepID=W6U8R8_ECHGR|nr:hypothetical protein EGR_08315 [Echinococcus granulosus]EUB56846.1 hypothetical protein EGR_08315 [Echinococcus granulosus]
MNPTTITSSNVSHFCSVSPSGRCLFLLYPYLHFGKGVNCFETVDPRDNKDNSVTVSKRCIIEVLIFVSSTILTCDHLCGDSSAHLYGLVKHYQLKFADGVHWKSIIYKGIGKDRAGVKKELEKGAVGCKRNQRSNGESVGEHQTADKLTNVVSVMKNEYEVRPKSENISLNWQLPINIIGQKLRSILHFICKTSSHMAREIANINGIFCLDALLISIFSLFAYPVIVYMET